jgi:hypothetical protein
MSDYSKLLEKCNIDDNGGVGGGVGVGVTLNNVKICTDRMNTLDAKKLNTIRDTFGSVDMSVARAAFMKNDLWSPGSEITIGFIDREPPADNWSVLSMAANHFRTPTPQIEQQSRLDQKEIDPLQLEITEESLVTSFVKRIVTERFEPYVNLKFTFLDEYPEEAMIRISFDPTQGAYSYLGRSNIDIPSDVSTMNLGWFDVATTIHEFCHMLGMVHEHQNPKDGVNWAPCRVFEWARTDQGWDARTTYDNIMKKYDTSELNASEFDPLSIMLYFFDDSLTKDGKGTKQNLRLSPLDVEYLNNMYALSGGNAVNQKATNAFYTQVYGSDLMSAFQSTYTSDTVSIRGGGGGRGGRRPTAREVAVAVIITMLVVGIIVGDVYAKRRSSSTTSTSSSSSSRFI